MLIASDIVTKEVSITLHYITLHYIKSNYITLHYIVAPVGWGFFRGNVFVGI